MSETKEMFPIKKQFSAREADKTAWSLRDTQFLFRF